MNLTELSTYTRDLTGVQSTDVVTATLLTRFINESYKELARRQNWPWLTSGTVTSLTASDSPVFAEEFHAVLSYRSAVKVLAFVSDDTPRAQSFTEEYGFLVKDMEGYYFNALSTGASTTLNDLTAFVRDLTAIYDDAIISDSLIKVYINNAYKQLAKTREWDWLETTVSSAMPAFSGGVHTINLSNGTRRILEAYVVDDSGYVESMVNVPSLIDVEPVEDLIKYDVTAAGVFTFKPEQDNSYLVKIRYLQSFASLGNNDSPLFASEFYTILAYRAAIMVLGQIQPDDPRVIVFDSEYQQLFTSMIEHYELDHDYRTLQFNSAGINTRKYFPWFKSV